MAEIHEDDALLAELGIDVSQKKTATHTPREERIIAGFEDIVAFHEKHGRAPQHGEDHDIFERLYAVRLDCLRAQPDCRTLLATFDKHGLLDGGAVQVESLDDDALLAELGVDAAAESDVTKLTHVRSTEEKRAAEEVANRTPCRDFTEFKPLFFGVESDLKAGLRQARPFGTNASIATGDFFILDGLTVYVAETGDIIRTSNGHNDARLRVIYSNGTESNLLQRSLQRALYKDESGRRITDHAAGPLFGDEWEEDDIASGTIYVLRSLSDHPFIAEHRELIHKIGVTGGKVETRIANAAQDATYLLADVEIVATYKLSDINRTKLENLLHRVFSTAKLDLTIEDRFGHPFKPREWFLMPLSTIDEVVDRIRDGTITEYEYDPGTASLISAR